MHLSESHLAIDRLRQVVKDPECAGAIKQTLWPTQRVRWHSEIPFDVQSEAARNGSRVPVVPASTKTCNWLQLPVPAVAIPWGASQFDPRQMRSLTSRRDWSAVCAATRTCGHRQYHAGNRQAPACSVEG